MNSPSFADRFQEMKLRKEKVAVLTAYDYPTARLLDESGVDVLLVGDSLGMVVLGFPDTTQVTLEAMLHHTAAVARGAKRAPVVADLPFGTYETPQQALDNARRLMDAGAQAVKLEGGRSHIAQVEAIISADIPVMGHIGMLPQSVREEGGYKIKGRTSEEAERLVDDATALEKAGVFAIVVELVEKHAAERVTSAVRIPTIGIGSGLGCDGQVLVTHDLIGMFPWFCPKFVSPKVHVAQQIRQAASDFIRETKQS